LQLVKSDLSKARAAGVPSSWLSSVSRAAGKLGWIITVLRLRAAATKLGIGSMGAVMRDAAAMSTDVLKILSLVSLGHMWAKMAAVASDVKRQDANAPAFYSAKLKTAEFYFKKVMPQAKTHFENIRMGSDCVYALTPDDFAHAQTTIGEKARG
jgi:hypothetical protein